MERENILGEGITWFKIWEYVVEFLIINIIMIYELLLVFMLSRSGK